MYLSIHNRYTYKYVYVINDIFGDGSGVYSDV